MDRYRKEFTGNTSIHGPKPIFSNRNGKSQQLAYLVIISFVLSFSVWQLNRTVSAYLTYDVKILKYPMDVPSIRFPAITICPNSGSNRLFVAATKRLVTGTYFASRSATFNLENIEKLCPSKGVVSLNITNGRFPSNYPNLTSFMRDWMPWAGTSVLSCKINGAVFENCSQWFWNKVTDSGYCFTFNHDYQVLNDYPIDIKAGSAFGSTLPYELLLKSSGSRAGVSMTLVTNQSQYCIPAGQDLAGFVAYVHDRSVEPILYVKRLIDLPPGFMINVGISVSRIKKTTENWPMPVNECFNRYSLFFYPRSVYYNNADNWRKNCVTNAIWTYCGCLPSYAPPLAFDVLKIEVSADLLCSVNQTTQLCMTKIEDKSMDGQSCTGGVEMPRPCEEMRYTIQTSAVLFPSKHQFLPVKRALKIESNLTLKEFRENFLQVNFFINSMSTDITEVSGRMSWIDLMNQMGGALGMSLGISMLSICEIVCWLFTNLMAVWFVRPKSNAHTTKYMYLS